MNTYLPDVLQTARIANNVGTIRQTATRMEYTTGGTVKP